MNEKTIEMITNTIISLGGTGKEVAFAFFAFSILQNLIVAGTILIIIFKVIRAIEQQNHFHDCCKEIAKAYDVYDSGHKLFGLSATHCAEICKFLRLLKQKQIFTKDEAVAKGWIV